MRYTWEGTDIRTGAKAVSRNNTPYLIVRSKDYLLVNTQTGEVVCSGQKEAVEHLNSYSCRPM